MISAKGGIQHRQSISSNNIVRESSIAPTTRLRYTVSELRHTCKGYTSRSILSKCMQSMLNSERPIDFSRTLHEL